MKRILALSMFVACSIHAQSIQQLREEVASLRLEVNKLRCSPVQALAPFVQVDYNPENGVCGPNIVITGANVHILNGLGATASSNGLGNMIVGYCENPDLVTPGYRSGSHNVIVGQRHTFLAGGYANLLCGDYNEAQGEGGFLSGYGNIVGNFQCSGVFGGYNNIVLNSISAIVGGESNEVMSNYTTLVGGIENTLNSEYAAMLGAP